MCVHNDPSTLKKFRRRTKSFKAYKILSRSGNTVYQHSVYGPGLCCTPNTKRIADSEMTAKYNRSTFGLHLYYTKESAMDHSISTLEVIVEVLIDPKTVIVAGKSCNSPHSELNQLAVTQFRITQKEWNKHRLPIMPSKKRIIK